jgi:hypothetical protein
MVEFVEVACWMSDMGGFLTNNVETTKVFQLGGVSSDFVYFRRLSTGIFVPLDVLLVLRVHE